MLQLTMGTKSESTVAAIQGLYDEVDDLLKNPATDAELKRAKDSILNSFIFNFDHPEKVVRERMTYEFYGFPLDFLERYRAGIEKTTAEDVARVAKKYIHPEQFATVVVGNPQELGNQLSALGPVAKWDITIPPPADKGKSASSSPGR
jgi:zinc protease